MNKIKIIGRFLVVTILLSVTSSLNQSCTSLEEELFSQVTTDDFFQDDNQFISALGSGYTSLYGFMGDFYAAQEVSTDEVIVPQRGQDWFDGGHWIRLHRQEYKSDDPIPNGTWNFLFGGVNTCNRLIFTFEELNAPGSEAFIAELRALRALFYFWLLDTYGNVPIVDQFDVPADYAPATSDRKDVYDFVEKELNESLPLLSDAADLSTYGRMNQWVARVLLAKLYLNAQVYTGTAQWQKALDQCNEVINSGNYSLTPNYFDNFKTDNGSSPETIFAIPYDQVFAQGNNLVMRTLHYSSQATYNLTAQPWNGYCSIQEFYNSFDDTDVRKASFLVGPQYSSAGTPISDPGYETNDPDGPEVNFTPEINQHFPNTLRQAGARIGKFEFALGATDNLSNDMPIFRYADVLLMKAECEWRLSTGDPLALVNEIRSRAEVPALGVLTPEDLIAERGRELCFEAQRRSDLIRFGKYNDEWDFKPITDPHVNIFPIPKNQLDANPNLKQNTGYN